MRHVEGAPHEPPGEGQVPLEHRVPLVEPLEGAGPARPRTPRRRASARSQMDAVGHHGLVGEALRGREQPLLEVEVLDGGPDRRPTWVAISSSGGVTATASGPPGRAYPRALPATRARGTSGQAGAWQDGTAWSTAPPRPSPRARCPARRRRPRDRRRRRGALDDPRRSRWPGRVPTPSRHPIFGSSVLDIPIQWAGAPWSSPTSDWPRAHAGHHVGRVRAGPCPRHLGRARAWS